MDCIKNEPCYMHTFKCCNECNFPCWTRCKDEECVHNVDYVADEEK